MSEKKKKFVIDVLQHEIDTNEPHWLAKPVTAPPIDEEIMRPIRERNRAKWQAEQKRKPQKK